MALFGLLGVKLLVVSPDGYRNILATACVIGRIDAVTAMLKLEQIRDAINTHTVSENRALAIATAKGHNYEDAIGSRGRSSVSHWPCGRGPS